MSALPIELRTTLGLFTGLAVLALIGWFLWRCLKSSVDPARLLFRWIVTAAVVTLLVVTVRWLTKDDDAGGQIAAVLAGAVFGLILAILWLPAIVTKVSEAFGSLYTGGGAPPTPTPAYSIAEARRKQNHFKEAIYAIQNELTKFPTDVTGQMLLAEIQAQDLRDLDAARTTIDRFLTQDHAPRNIAFALNSLADWHLKLHRDSDSARTALARIVEMLPETEEAQNASQRIAHLASSEAMRERDQVRPIAMPTGRRDLGLIDNFKLTVRGDETPEETLNRLIAHLAEHPLDREAREKLALVYSNDFKQPDAAIEQFEQLAQLPNQSPRDVAKWINHIADLQVQQGVDYEPIRDTLQRIIDQFPGLAPAELARQRIEILRLELKGKNKGQTVKLGVYEKDLGLKNPEHPPHPPEV